MSKEKIEKMLLDVKERLDKIVPEVDILEKQAKLATGRIMEVKVANKMGEVYSSIESYKSSGHRSLYDYILPDAYNEVCEVALKHAQSLFDESTRIHNENIEAIQNNVTICEKLKTFMEAIGISAEYDKYEYPSTRSRTKKYVKYTAGWIQDMHRCVCTNDAYSMAVSSYGSFKKRVDEFRTANEKKLQDAEKERLKIETDNTKLAERIAMCLKYDLDIASDWNDIMEHLLDKNKYLRLGHALYMNRSDWNEGYSHAEHGIKHFIVETTVDKAIERDINACIMNWDGDGRIFRDTTWNYDKIYALVEDEELRADYLKVLSNV